MKHLLPKFLVVAVGAALAAQSASATNTYNGPASGSPDLLLGFREAGFNDLVLDIGSASTYLNATASINLDTLFPLSGTYTTLSGLLQANFGGTASNVTWSVVGSAKPGSTATFAYVTDSTDTTTPVVQSALTAASNDANNYGLQYQNATAGNTKVANLAANVPSGTSSYTHNGPLVSSAMGFSVENTITGGLNSTADFYVFAPNADGTQPANLGIFEIDANGNGEYVVVPEPSTCGLAAAGGLLFLALRRRVTR